MRKLLVLLVLVGAIGLVGDQLARQRAESAIEAAIEARVERVSSVDATISSFPFLGRLVATGRVERLRMHLRDVAEQDVNVEVLTVDATGIRLSRQVLLGESRVKVTAVDDVTATVRISEDEVRRVSGADIRLLDGSAEVTAAGATVTATVEASTEGGITFSVAGLPSVTVPLPATDLLPCAPTVEVVLGAVEASCSADRLPQIVVDAIGAAELQAP